MPPSPSRRSSRYRPSSVTSPGSELKVGRPSMGQLLILSSKHRKHVGHSLMSGDRVKRTGILSIAASGFYVELGSTIQLVRNPNAFLSIETAFKARLNKDLRCESLTTLCAASNDFGVDR